MFEVEGVKVVRAPATTATFQVYAGNVREDGKPLLFSRIRVLTGDGRRLLQEFPVHQRMECLFARVKDWPALKGKLGLDRRGHSPMRASKAELAELSPGLYSCAFRLDLGPYLSGLKGSGKEGKEESSGGGKKESNEGGKEEGKVVKLQIVGDFVGDGKTISLFRPLEIEFQPALPAVDYPGWIRFSGGTAGQASGDAAGEASRDAGGGAAEDAEIQTIRPGIPPLASGWYAGDLHLHTAFSDAFFITVDSRVAAARDRGLKWIILTDHAQMMTAADWTRENQEVDEAQVKYGIPAMAGLEISTRLFDSGNPNDSHYLAYDLASFFYNPDPEARDGQQIIDDVNNNNPGASFGALPHPLSPYYPWVYWDAHGYTGFEILTGPNDSNADPRALAKWDELLSKGIPDTLATGKFVVGIGAGDAHNFSFGDHSTYIYVPEYTSTDRTAIYNALRVGRAVATSDGSIAIFAVNNFGIGSMVPVANGETVNLWIRAVGVTTRTYVRRINIISAGGEVVRSLEVAGETTDYQATVTLLPGETGYPAGSTYYRVEVEFLYAGVLQEKSWYVYTNPIFIRYGPA